MSKELSLAESNDAASSSARSKTGSGSVGSKRSPGSTPEPDQAPQFLPLFQPIRVEDAKTRANVEQWRTFSMLLEPQPGSQEAAAAFSLLTKIAEGDYANESGKTRFTIVTKESLADTAKQNGISGKRALAQAMLWTMTRDKQEGLLEKRRRATDEKNKQRRDEDDEIAAMMIGDEEFERGNVDISSGRGNEHGSADQNKETEEDGKEEQRDEDVGDELDAIARKQAEREQAKLELRAARMFISVDDDLGRPDRVYILKGFPTTDADAAQFLEENHAYFTAPLAKKRKDAPEPPVAGTDGKPEFLSVLDAIVQLTTKDLAGPLASRVPPGSHHEDGRTDSRPGTASSSGSAVENISSGSRADRGGKEGGDEHETHQARVTTWERVRSTSGNLFTHASGVTKALALAQTKGGTAWQDLSFCYLNVLASEDPSTEVKLEKGAVGATGKGKTPREVKDMLELTKEFAEMVTQMAFEKFDFHQWFSTAELTTLPRRASGLDLARAVEEAQSAATGLSGGGYECVGGSFHGSAARVEGSQWATDPTLVAYSDLMLAVPEELTSVATAIYCMVEAVMLECTGTDPQPLDTRPPAAVTASCSSSSSNASIVPSLSTVGRNNEGSAPFADRSVPGVIPKIDSPVLQKAPFSRSANLESYSAHREGSSTFASSGPRVPARMPLSRNLVLDYGDYVGERAVRGALNRSAASATDKVDPRSVIGVERSAVLKLQNPRLVGHGALPREPLRNEKDRGTEQSELLMFTRLGKKDVDRTRQIWAFEHLVNSKHPPLGKNASWSFVNRRFWDVLPPHAVPQVVREENGTEPRCLRQYYEPTDELLVALHHVTPAGRACIFSWDPSTSGSVPFKFRPAFKDWATMALAKDHSYTPRTLCALGAIMDVSKANLDRAKTKSVKMFPADHSLVALSGFVATRERWLSVFMDSHVMGLRLTENYQIPSRGGASESPLKRGTMESPGADAKRTQHRQPKFAARLTMGFDDNSRLVIAEGIPAAESSPVSAGKRTSKSTAASSATNSRPKSGRSSARKRPHGKPDGFGTVSCAHTFPTGLVVTTGSSGTVRMEFVVDAVRDGKQRVVKGFAPKAARDELVRVIVGRGTVVRYMRDGSKQILFVTGDVVIRKEDEEILIDKYGRSFRRSSSVDPAEEKSPDTTVPLAAALNAGNPTAEDWIPIHSPVPGKLQTPGNSETEQSNHALKVEPSKPGTNVNLQHTTAASAIRDAETWAVVHSPPGGEGRAVVVYEDGLTVTRHADGTVQRWWRGEGKAGTGAAELVLVECAGFASVEVDVEIQEMCLKHAKGKPVTITRGGNRVRLRTSMPNGGVTLVSYDTRVTSQVCGRVIYVHPDNTEVIASDKGEVIVRPRGLWEGRPVHDILAGANSSMPPNSAQRDLLVGAYRFDCLKGIMESEDTDRNQFFLDVTKTDFLKEGFSIAKAGSSTGGGAMRPPSSGSTSERRGKGSRASGRPSSGKADGVLIDLAGETAGMRSNALVDNPLEPRLFVYRRDGSALELLRNNDVKRWRDQFLLESPAARQGRRGGKERVGRKDAIAPHLSVSVREEQCWVDPHALEARQLSFYVKMHPASGGEGSLAALMRQSAVLFGEDYCEDVDIEDGQCWRTRPLPLNAKVLLERYTEDSGSELALEACVRRVWLEHLPLSTEATEELRRALAEWGSWKRRRVEQMDRFSVADPRPVTEKEAQSAVQKLVRKAFREAKALKQKQKEKVRAAKALAAKEQQLRASRGGDGTLRPVSQSETVLTATTSGGLLTIDTSTFGGGGGGSTDEGDGDDGDAEDDMDFPDSDEEEDPEIVLLRQESAAAYSSAGGDAVGHLETPALRLALIAVLGRAVKETEAESLLLGLRKRTFGEQKKASMTDLFRILSVAKGQPADKPPPHPSDDVDELLSHPTSTTPSKIPPSYPVEMHTRILTGDFTEPVPFWDTPLGRSIGHTSTVTWAVGASKVQPATEKEGGWVADYPSAGNAADGVDAVGDALTTTTTGNESAAIEADNGSSGSTHGDGLCVKRSSNPNCNEIGFACASRKPSHQEPHNGDETSLPIQTSVGVTETSWKNTESRHDTRNLDKAPPTLECWLDPAEQEGTMESAAGHSQQQSPTTRHGCGDRVDVLDGVRRESVAGNVAGTPAQGTGAQAVRRLVKGPSARESLGWTHGGRGHELGGKESSVFRVYPATISLRRVELGRSYPLKLQVTNVGEKPARFRVDHNTGGTRGESGCLQVSNYPHGKVAAGLAVTVPLQLVADRAGALKEVLSFVAEDGITDVIITAEVVEVDKI